MKIVVCVKVVPDTTASDLVIAEDKRSIKKQGVIYQINEADNYALEEALRIKERFGGSVTVVTVGGQETTEQLRICLAKGADSALRLDDARFAGSDGLATARILCAAIKDMSPDLVLTGCVASDDGYGQVGVQLGELLGYNHATLVSQIQITNGKVEVRRELEGGLGEILEVELPAVLAVQTGINEPRYASFRAIKEAMKQEIKVLGLVDLQLDEHNVGEAGSGIRIEELFVPSAEKMAQMLDGSLDEVTDKLISILKERRLI